MSIEFTLRQQQVVKDNAYLVVSEVTGVTGVTVGLGENLGRAFLVSCNQGAETLYRVCTVNDYLTYEQSAAADDYHGLSIFTSALFSTDQPPWGPPADVLNGGPNPFSPTEVVLLFDLRNAGENYGVASHFAPAQPNGMDIWDTVHTTNNLQTAPNATPLNTVLPFRVIANNYVQDAVLGVADSSVVYIEPANAGTLGGPLSNNAEFPSALMTPGRMIPFYVSDTDGNLLTDVSGLTMTGLGTPIRSKDLITGGQAPNQYQQSTAINNGLVRSNVIYQYFASAAEMSNAALAIQTQLTSLTKNLNVVSDDLDITITETYGA